MLNLAILCIVCALLYAFRGGQVFVTEWERRLEWLTAQPNPTPEQLQEIAELEKRWWPKKLRKPIYCIVTGAVFAVLAWDIWAGVIVGVGSLLPPLTSPIFIFISAIDTTNQNNHIAKSITLASQFFELVGDFL